MTATASIASKGISKAEIERLAEGFETSSVEDILHWAVRQFAPHLTMTSSFGAEGIVLIDKLARIAPEIPIIYLDTGFHFPETEELKEQMRARYGLKLIEQRAELSVENQTAIYGDRLFERDPDLCCKMRKVEPLRDALAGYDAWIAALRRDQSPTRASIAKVEWNAKHGMVKINPIADWTKSDVWNYILKQKLPYNRLHDEGYTSIGCRPCTQPTKIGSHERSGRWAGQRKLECGIHL
jgi:phosphoadenosine phosphosulfate reductase